MRPGCLPPSDWAVLSRPGLSAPQRPHNKDWHIYMLTLHCICIGSRITAYRAVSCVPHCQGFQFSPWLPSHCYVVPAPACPSLPSSLGLGLGSTCEGWVSPAVSHLCSPASYCQIVILISPRLSTSVTEESKTGQQGGSLTVSSRINPLHWYLYWAG